MGQLIKNAHDATSITQIADGALEEATTLIQAIRVKAVQASGDGQSPESRHALQSDISHALKSLSRITQDTSFNSQKLLSGTFTDRQFQTGLHAGETIRISIPSVDPSNLGSGETATLSAIDVTTTEGAQNAVTIADKALEQISAIRSSIGSAQNQLSSTISNLTTTRINFQSSASAMMDIDLAEESMDMSKFDLLSKTRMFAAAQANASHKNVVALFSQK